ncbi:MAG: isoleucine--tRNA ligase [Bacteroidales bacterium]|nr:isoleucine--tRNA ligase [Bacteroidales bacterium]
MGKKFAEYKQFNLSEINKEILDKWQKEQTFKQSLETREGAPDFIFYEGPPSANGKPGIHHILSRTIKDSMLRYKSAKGYLVNRKAGWDTHGLPVELGVEKSLGITKEDIGKSISVEDYNKSCRKAVMQFTEEWKSITEKIGYWVDLDHPYITYTSDYIETLWWLLKQLYNKGLLYKGYTIQPFSPAAGTGLSSHELNMPGCYKDVKDTTATVLFKAINNTPQSKLVFESDDEDVRLMAWTTTPWTLFSNTALCMGPKITYVKIKTINQYTGKKISVIMAKDLVHSYFPEKNKDLTFEDYKEGSKDVPYQIVNEYLGSELAGMRYEQLLPYVQPTDGDAFRVITGDFVTTSDGAGIVHIAPSFGADDYRVAKQNGIGSLTLVNRQGKLVEGLGEFSGKVVKKSYDSTGNTDVDVDIVVELKKQGKLFKSEKITHSYPHCWRTNQPILYYPLDSWFIRTTAVKERMIELNKTINWQPPSTGSGRFGQWLESLIDWNLSRSRYWGTPLPIWRTEDGSEEICIGSFEELMSEIEKSIKAGFMQENPYKDFVVGDYSKENYEKIDPHKPYIDSVILVSASGKPMRREPDLVDVWFDSGAMPYAQLHYPFENKELFKRVFPASFIAEGVDQTRGWFFTLHAIATMVFDSVAFKNVISNGLVLDKNGEKMSKSRGNSVEPFSTIEKFGSDPVRWYMITNASPWENLKFDIDGVDEIKRKFFGTLYNTYSFFALYANVDGFTYSEKDVPINERPEIDRWILSLLNTLIKNVDECFASYDMTKAGRMIQDFVTENLSNWYVRLNRKRFWGGEYNTDKISAYQTLYTCLEKVAQLMAPISPFYSDKIFQDLNAVTEKHKGSVHIANYPVCDQQTIDQNLEDRMEMAQKISSMVLALRRKASLKVRQPLQKIMVPILNADMEEKIEAVKKLILTEVNVKELEYLHQTAGILTKKVKADFKQLGRKLGKNMKNVANLLAELSQEQIADFEAKGSIDLDINGEKVNVLVSETEITSEDIPGRLVANEGRITVALDINITPELKNEGYARELINRIQNMRKESGFDVTDKIKIEIVSVPEIEGALKDFKEYICSQTLTSCLELKDQTTISEGAINTEIDEQTSTLIRISKI